MYCDHCGVRYRQVPETVDRRIRDLPILAFRVVLIVPCRRLWCESCGGPRLEKLCWLGRYQRVTNRLAEAVHQLLRSGNILVVAECLQLSWHTVKAWSKALLHQSLPAPDWSPIHHLAMDMFALHKGHRDAMVMAAPSVDRSYGAGMAVHASAPAPAPSLSSCPRTSWKFALTTRRPRSSSICFMSWQNMGGK